jgi:hypothetical protein
MSDEKILTNNGFNVIFHPFLLKRYNSKINDYAIIPQYTGSDTIDSYKKFSNNTKTFTNNLTSKDIEKYFTSNEFFLSANLQINSINDIYQKLDELIISNRKIGTIDIILDIILSTYKKDMDDIAIDKLIDFYQKYFNNFFSKQIEYKELFKQLQQTIELNINKPHDYLVNNILKK